MTKKTKTPFFDLEAVLIVIAMGMLFGIGSCFSYEISVKFFSLGFFFGSFCAFAGLPYIDNKKWKPRPWTCAVLAMLGATAFAILSGRSNSHVFYFSISGLVIGYFAPSWAKHM